MKINKIRLIFLLGILTLISFNNIFAYTLKVGVIHRPPFTFVYSNNYEGITVRLWKNIAKALNWEYEFIGDISSIEQGISLLKRNKLDVFLAPISVNYKREKFVSFSRPYFISQSVFLLEKYKVDIFTVVLRMLKSIVKSNIFYIFIFIFFLCFHLIWFCERKCTLSAKYFKGISGAIWFTFRCFTAQDISHPVNPKRTITRCLITVVLITSILTFSSITASITSKFTLGLEQGHYFNHRKDLKGKEILAIGDHNYKKALKLGALVTKVNDFKEAKKLLKTKRFRGIVTDKVLAQYFIKHHLRTNLSIVPINIGYDEYAMAFKQGSRFLPQFNRTLVNLRDENYMSFLCKEYLTSEEAYLCEL